MHHRLVDFDTESAGKSAISQTGGLAAVVADIFAGYCVQLLSGDPGFYPLGHLSEGLAAEQ